MSDDELVPTVDATRGRIKLDDDFLRKVGLAQLPLNTRRDLQRAFYNELEVRVGKTIARAMNGEQLAEFEAYMASKDEAGAFAWLERNFPLYKHTVHEEYDRMEKELIEATPLLLRELSEAQG